MSFVLAFLLLIQFIPVDRTHPPIKKEENFVEVVRTPSQAKEILKQSCYDCHSYETKYPRIAYVAPVSWSIQHNINKARVHLNFSNWTSFNKDLRTSMLENAIRVVQNGQMPVPGYTAQHPQARLTEIEREELVNYFKSVLEQGNY